MEEGKLPGNLHYHTPNPNIPALTDGSVQIVDKNTAWAGGIVGISAFGYGGANSHVIVKSPNHRKHKEHTASSKLRLFTCTAR